ncbi:MAG: peptidoglycan-binding protein [Gammaproteobacteria bacterium]|nr:peptidoglycan-binding protein [Gammaproteobacteria bacterium]
MHTTFRFLAWSTCALSMLVSTHTYAADPTGQFAVRGGGRITCEQFVKARDDKNANVLAMVAGWLDGYLTGTNQHMSGNYAVAPWASTQLLGLLLYHNCKQHPTANFFVAANSMVQQMQGERMTEVSPIVVAENEGKTVQVYQEVLRRLQVALTEKGLYKGPPSGEYSADVIAAIKEYQRTINQPESGIPDQRVLWELLRPKIAAKK